VTLRSAAPEFMDPWRAALAYALLAAVLTVVVGLPLAVAWRDGPPAPRGLGTFDLFAGHLLLAAFLVVWFALQQRDEWRAFLALPSGGWPGRLAAGARLGLAGWLLTLAAMAALGSLATAAGVQPREGFSDLVVWLATRPLGLRVLLIASAMVVEETFFRAFLQPRIGLIPATACFALGHAAYGSPTMSGGVLVIGLVLGLSFRRHRDLLLCITAHGVFDAIQLLVVLPLAAPHLEAAGL
jgi:membrane protease YdiL (CAAX protease family)